MLLERGEERRRVAPGDPTLPGSLEKLSPPGFRLILAAAPDCVCGAARAPRYPVAVTHRQLGSQGNRDRRIVAQQLSV